MLTSNGQGEKLANRPISPATREPLVWLCCNHCVKRHEDCIVPDMGATCMCCKDHKVKCSLALGHKRGRSTIDEDEESEEGSEGRRLKKKVKAIPSHPRASPVSVSIPQGGRASLNRIAVALEATNQLVLHSMVAAKETA